MRIIELKSGKTKLAFLLAIVFLVGLVFMGNKLISAQYKPVDTKDKTVKRVVIPEQSSARQIAKILMENDLIHNEKAFLKYCRRHGYDSNLKAGHYQLNRSLSLQEITRIITEGQTLAFTLTVPEGYTVGQIGDLLVNKGICTIEEWNEAISLEYDFNFLQYGKNLKQPLEGFLFPDTYRIEKKASAEVIVKTMLRNFDLVWQENFAKQANKTDKDIYEIITIAAMIEKETVVAEERSTIAGVIDNRLKINMPLQIDATVLYALGKHKEKVYEIDLLIDSPYNTYKYNSLPLGPIASPGKAAIDAALNPEEHDFLYYVAKGDGSHHFSHNYDEHLRAKAKYID